MKVTEKKMGDGYLKLEATASPAEVNHAFTLAEQAFASQYGLRPANSAQLVEMAKEQLGIKDLDAIINKDALEFLAPFAIEKRNLIPAYPAKPASSETLKRNAPFEFTVTVKLKPDYELDSYDPVTVTLPPMEIHPEEVEAQIQQILSSYTEYIDIEPHPVGPNDCFEIALKVSQDGKELENISTDNRLYVMGMGYMPPSFDENVMGMEVGQTKEFSFQLPGAEGEETFDCVVTINQMKEKKIPELTDEWVRDHMFMFPTAAAMRESIEKVIAEEHKRQADEMALSIAAAELGKRFHQPIPDEAYEFMRSSIMENLQMNLAQQGIPFNEFVQSQGGEQTFGMMLMMQARQMLVQGYSLDALFRHENMTIDDADLMAAAAALNPQNPGMVKQMMENTGRMYVLRESAQRLKANRWLLDHAQIIEAESPAPVAE